MPVLRLVRPGGTETITAEPGTRLSSALWLSPLLPPTPLCNGLGLCGRCRVRFLSCPPEPCEAEREYFSEEELAAGWRLACRHLVPDVKEVALEILPESGAMTAIFAKELSDQVYLGIDLGTTSIQWKAVTASGEAVAEGNGWNPQGGAGADIVSRLAMAQSPGGRRLLSSLVANAITDITKLLAQKGGKIERICIAANSAMTEILLDKDVSGLCGAPYSLSFSGGASCPIPDTDLPEILFPPLPAPFVGGDISAGLLAIMEKRPPLPFLIMDFGTNGELALLRQDHRLFLTSAPLGPALEGAGPACGQPAAKGAVTGWRLEATGLVPIFACGEGAATGITATGYVSLLALLHRLGVLNSRGHFEQGNLPLARKISAGLVDQRLNLQGKLFLTATDVELLLKVKAALAVALKAILTFAHIEAAGVAEVYMAGALGENLPVADLVSLGFIPIAFSQKIRTAGNTSLAGACLLAREPDKMQSLVSLCANAEIINLVEDEAFMEKYLAAMHWGMA